MPTTDSFCDGVEVPIPKLVVPFRTEFTNCRGVVFLVDPPLIIGTTSVPGIIVVTAANSVIFTFAIFNPC
jgi:hypothetical protein